MLIRKLIPRQPFGGASTPYDLVNELLATHYFVQDQFQVMRLDWVAMEPDAPIIGKQFFKERKPLIHELEVVIICPDVGVLDLFAKSVTFTIKLCCPPCASQCYFPYIVRTAVEGWVNVNEIHLSSNTVGQKMC